MLTVRNINDEFISDLNSGVLQGTLELVKTNQGKFILCIRSGYINIYYRGHSLYKIVQLSNRTAYNVLFDFNHARYTEDWKEKHMQLEELGFVSKPPVYGKSCMLKGIQCKNHTLDFNVISRILTQIIDDFYDTHKGYDYFKQEQGIPQSTKSKSSLLEKERQQQIYSANQNTINGFCFYDMEFSQSRNSRNDEQFGKPDMLAIEIKNNKPSHLVFVELKTTMQACNGKSGFEKHNSDIDRYLLNTNLINMRKEEAKANIAAFVRLGLLNSVELIHVLDLPVKKLFIFSDEAITFAEKIISNEDIIMLNAPYIL